MEFHVAQVPLLHHRGTHRHRERVRHRSVTLLALDARVRSCQRRQVKSCGPSGSQDLALFAEPSKRPPPYHGGSAPLPWRFRDVMRVHARSLATRFLLQIRSLCAVEIRREASRVAFLMCPLCVRAVLPGKATLIQIAALCTRHGESGRRHSRIVAPAARSSLRGARHGCRACGGRRSRLCASGWCRGRTAT